MNKTPIIILAILSIYGVLVLFAMVYVSNNASNDATYHIIVDCDNVPIDTTYFNPN